ncbi:MAG: proline--tRNA ligase [Bacteroidia bacterium]|nr:proline--tRNA ligase [Bacteroidia bacterium]MDW8334683.1 proline--tRNA ligase [Bacteroidia bacterium]
MSEKLTRRADNYSEWYNELVKRADLAEHSPVRGCMVVKPYGFAIWEGIQRELDARFKATGHANAYFPLFIPKSFLSREAEHVDGFAKECAVVTHHRLMNAPDGSGVVVDPEAKLAEELIVRPTSETIIWHHYKDWIRSYRDLPILLNQWANVVRWEMRPRLFLRTTEFLWQEGHTAHATAEEALAEAKQMLEVYADFVENVMAVPVVRGVKTANERFAGALETFCIEAMMQDGKALQAGTSHFLGQNFAKAFDVKYLTADNREEYVWATSWGVSTRLMGALIMTHGDDDGLCLPPKLAPIHVVVVPVYKNDDEREAIRRVALDLLESLRKAGLNAKFDDDDSKRPGWKFAEWELKGVPVRVTVGPKDLAENRAEVFRRDRKTKTFFPFDCLVEETTKLLNEIQRDMFAAAKQRLERMTVPVDDYAEFQARLDGEGGFLAAHWDGSPETEELIKQETKATIRCIPLDFVPEAGKCIRTGQPSRGRVLFARAY